MNSYNLLVINVYINKLINNRLARLEAGGVDITSALDDRTALEKLLNLRQNQGALRDVFEVLGRPQQALFSGWKASQEGKDIKGNIIARWGGTCGRWDIA